MHQMRPYAPCIAVYMSDARFMLPANAHAPTNTARLVTLCQLMTWFSVWNPSSGPKTCASSALLLLSVLFVASRSCVASSAEDGIVVIGVAIYSTASAFVDFGGALDADVFSDVVGFGFDTTAGLLCLYGGELALASCAVRGARTLRLESIHSYTLSLSLSLSFDHSLSR